jgi:hypothetical protein
MGALLVGAAGQALPIPGSPRSGSVDIIELFLYLSVARMSDGTPIGGLTGSNFSVKVFTSPESTVDVPTMAPQLDGEGNPVLDANGNPVLVSLVQQLAQPGAYFLSGAVRGLSAQAFLVAATVAGGQGQTVAAAARFLSV